MIKPIYGAASLGVVRVDNLQQLETAYKRVTRELAKAHIVAGALQAGEEDEFDAAGDAIETTTTHVRSLCMEVAHVSTLPDEPERRSSRVLSAAKLRFVCYPRGFTLECLVQQALCFPCDQSRW